MSYSEIILPLLIGFALDSLLGDPRWLPHPIRLFGRLISMGEKQLNSGKNRKLKGAILTLALIAFVWTVLFYLLNITSGYKYLQLVITSAFVFYGVANRSLISESVAVIKHLKNKGIEAGRKQLSFIVGRETGQLSENEIRIAVLETLAENLSDGVIAPLFFYCIGGVPAMFAYKMVNTLDSMIGYKSEKYRDFGWFAARLDDVVNFIPARITALLMVLITFSFRGAKFVFKYGRKHSSPNAGCPEAALAGILDCRFGGANYYHGALVEKPFIGKNNRIVTDRDIYKTCIINMVSVLAFIALFTLVFYPYLWCV
jgi:adenosylcobinamide-phosphate synthase